MLKLLEKEFIIHLNPTMLERLVPAIVHRGYLIYKKKM